ncbi:MAG: CHAT domain-containing protein, partial [Theionarchaea archaeon]|nr:CHAT domain-containing protein [Theionarchaea archaeon]
KALKTLRIHAEKSPEYIGDVALILMNLGLLYWNTGRFSEAEEAYSEALKIYRELLVKTPSYSGHLATTLNNLGILYQNTQRFIEAEHVHKEALSLLEPLEKTPDVNAGIADAFSHLGNLYWATKQFDKAEETFKKSLHMRRALLEKTGGFALDVVMALINLGNVYKDTQNFQDAENMYIEALKMGRDLVERDPESYTPCVGLILNNLGIVYHDTKQVDRAEKAFTEALTIRRRLAEKNPHAYIDVAMTLNNMGLFYRNVGKYSKGKQVYREALQYYRREEEVCKPDIGRTLNNLGVLYGDMQEFSQAEKIFKEALHVYRELGSQEYALDTAGTLRNLGNLYRDAKRFDRAELMYNEALRMYEHLEKRDRAFTPHVASMLNDIGIFYQDTRKFFEAETALKEALHKRMILVKKNPKAYAVDLAGTWNNLGILYNEAHLQGNPRFEEAETVFKKALETFERFNMEYPAVFAPHVAGMLQNLGALYKDTGRFVEAENMHTRALELRLKLEEENPEVYAHEVADSLTSLGILYEKMGKWEAEAYYQEAFEKYKELGLWFDAANCCYSLSQMKSDRRFLLKARKLIEIGILLSGEGKYVYAQKGMYEPVYWSMLHEDVSSFSVIEALRDPELLSLPWRHILSKKDLDRNDIESQKRMVDTILGMDIPAVSILEGRLKGSLFIYVQNLRDYVLFLVVGDNIQRFVCKKEFLEIGDRLLLNLRMQRGAAQKTDDFTFVTEKFDELSRKWSALLPDEIKGLLQESDSVIFSPDGYCSFFPLEALQVDGVPLCLEKTVVRATSLHQFSCSEKNPSFDSSLIVGNPWPTCKKRKLIYSSSGSEQIEISFLERAEEEAKALKETLPSATLLSRVEATGEKFLSEISNHSLIHFSGHGSLGRILFLSGPFKGFPPSFEPEEFSNLRKAGRGEGTKKINMMEEWHPVTDLDLYDVTLTNGAVIFLNACETGQHKYAGGGYYQGLPSVFLKNGAHSVVSSLVPIFDESSKRFALHFYSALLHTHSVAIALKKARIWAKNEYKAPIHWVPYIHYGPPL